jgi:hypothetical protein
LSNTGERTDCYIKNLDWKNNPVNFKYKLQIDDKEIKEENITTTSEFSIDNECTYKRFKVEMDHSTNETDRLPISGAPIWNEDTLFLRTLVEGDATLYEYLGGSIRKFFYETKTSKIQQLIYLKYTSEENEGIGKISENNSYQKQLYDNVSCGNITIKDMTELTYKKEYLSAYFTKYNECKNPLSIKAKPKQKKGELLLRITPSINFVSLTVPARNDRNVNVNANNKTFFKIGFEGEYILPYNKKKWSLFIDPTYLNYENETTSTEKSYFLNQKDEVHSVKIKYTAIEIPFGVRHYMFLNKTSQLFINAAYIFEINGKATINYDQNEYYNSKTNQSFGFGLGYSYKNKITIEMRMNTNKNLLAEYPVSKANYKSFGFIFGYKIL